MKRILLALWIAALGSIPASAAFSWQISQNLNNPSWSTGFMVLGSLYQTGPGVTQFAGSGCAYMLSTSTYNANVVQTVYTSSAQSGTIYEYLGANAPSPGDTSPNGNYIETSVSASAINVYWNSGSGLVQYATAAGAPNNSTVMTVVQGSEIGVLVNGVLVIDVTISGYSMFSSSAGLGTCVNGVSFYLTHVDIGSGISSPTAPTGLAGSSYTNHIDLSWTAATDPSGLGLLAYKVYRTDQPAPLTTTTGTMFSDTTVVPGTPYTYYVVARNEFLLTARSSNYSTRTVGITTTGPYPSVTPEGRRVGIHSTGAYWGASPENIDVRSGNLNFAMPILSAIGRTGMTIPFNLIYNSQNWRLDSLGNWIFDKDAGYGFGWRMMAGAVTPIWNAGGLTASYYLFVDATGAEYRLDQNASNVWSSKDSIYVYFDANTNILYFRDGTYWYMGCVSAATEADAGTMYPTLMQDTAGNPITVAYSTAYGGATWANSSSRISSITDVRSTSGPTYSVGTGGVTTHIGDGVSWTFGYAFAQPLVSPIDGTSSGTVNYLSSAATPNSTFSFTYDTGGELTKIVLPKGGYLAYDYGTVTYPPSGSPASAHSFRQVTNRYLSKDGTTQTTYAFSHEASPTADTHSFTQLNDPGGVGQKYWVFSTSGADDGLVTQYKGNQLPGPVTKTQNDFVWAQDAVYNSYVASTTTTLDPATAAVAKKTTQTVDIHGNVTQVQNFDYTNLVTPARTYTYTYLDPSVMPPGFFPYPPYMYNRMTQATVTDGTNTVTLATNTYHWLSPGLDPTPNGALVSSITPAGTTTLTYLLGGQIASTTVNGVTQTASYTGSPNSAAPTQITVGSLTNTMSYTSFLGLSNETGPNGDSSSLTYDTSARPSTATSPFGAVTTLTYPSANVTAATVNGRWTKTTVDGLGRTIKVETGTGALTTTPVSVTETAFDSCGCSPQGKLKQTSLPHANGATPIWTTYSYDGIGRTVSVLSPDGASTTSYSYAGNVVTVTDPALKWKNYTSDAFGRLIQVEEPNPAGGSYFTFYSYDVLDHLIQVCMPRPSGTITSCSPPASGTQIRTFNYGTPPGAYLLGATNPENGTVAYTYDAQKRVATITDAKSQRRVFTYDSYNRVTIVQRGAWSGGSFTEDLTQRTTNTYDTGGLNTLGRLGKVLYNAGNCASGTPMTGNCGTITESYSYNAGGAMTSKSLLLTRAATPSNATGTLTGSWAYDNEGRVTDVTYPTWHPCSGCTNSGSHYSFSYDTLGRLNTMNDVPNSATFVSGVTYGVANEELQVSTPLHSPVSAEVRTYNSVFQLTRMTQTDGYPFAGPTTVLDKQYAFPIAGANNGKITSQTDVISGETVAYTYDSLNRLASAYTTSSSTWGQSYTYDGFGNLTNQTVILGTAPSMSVVYDPATNRQVGEYADANGNITGRPSYLYPAVYDIENRLTNPGGSSSVTMRYAYDAGNKRVWRGDPSTTLTSYPFTGQTLDELTFWGGNQKLATYEISQSGGSIYFTLINTNVYFGGRLSSKGARAVSGAGADAVALTNVAADRLGSIGKFYPYGQERSPIPPNDTEKFTGYFRDAVTGANGNLDYADQRYHQPGVGRFVTPDPSASNVHFEDPSSLNAYVYGNDDPANNTDVSGLCSQLVIAGINMKPGSDPHGFGAYSQNAIAVYPYSSTAGNNSIASGFGMYTGILQVAAQFFKNDSSTMSTVLGLYYAASDGKPINVTTFSGAAATLTAAVKFLNANGGGDTTSLIQSVTYVSPGNVGSLYTTPDIANTKIYTGNDTTDHAVTLLTSFGAITPQVATECGHDFGCIAKHFGFDTKPPDCDDSAIIVQRTLWQDVQDYLDSYRLRWPLINVNVAEPERYHEE